jgi:uncharacterized delta-60 repeat protein
MKCRTLLFGFVFLLSFGVFLEPLEAQHGIVITPIGTADDVGYSIKVQADGKVVVGGYYYTATSEDFVALRYHAHLGLDSSFDTDGVATHGIYGDDHAESLIIQPDGKILLGGVSNAGGEMAGDDQFTVARLDTDGSADTGFGPSSNGHITKSIGSSWDLGRTLGLRSDGRIVLGGYVDDGAGNWNFALLGLKADGTLDPTFNPGGTYGMSPNSESMVVTSVDTGDDRGHSIAIQADGKILLAGASHNGTDNDLAIVRYETDGDLDTTFGTGGMVTTDLRGYNDWGTSIALQSDGKIVFGSKSSNGTVTDFAVVRYNTDGSLDTTFGTGGKVFTPIGSGDDDGSAVTLQSDGKIVLAGFTWNGTDEDFAVVRYNTDGSLDTTFGSGGKVVTPVGSADDRIHGVTVQPDGKILVVGDTDNGSNLDVAVARYNTDGTLDETVSRVWDTFTESSDTALTSHTPDIGTGWTEVFDDTTPGTNAQVIASRDIVQAGDGDETNTGQAYTAQPDPTSVDQAISITLSALETDNNTKPVGIFGRRTDNDNFYYVRILPNGHDTYDTVELWKMVSGTPTSLGSYDATLAANTVIKLEIRDASKKVYVDGTERISSSDNTLTGAGTWGLFFGNYNGTGGNCRTTWDLDNFLAEEPVSWYGDSCWKYRKNLTLDAGLVEADQTDFPVLISFTGDSDLAAGAQSDFDDVLFTSADGTTKLSHEIEDYDSTNGDIVAWVKIPSLSSSIDTEIYMYYGCGTAGDQQNASDVWSNGFIGVWHLHDDYNDSTSNNNDMTASGTPTYTSSSKIA